MTSPLRRIVAEKRWALRSLAAVLLLNATTYLFVVRPLARSSIGVGDRAAAAAGALNVAERELVVARTLAASKVRADEELNTFFHQVLPASQSDAVRMTYARLPALARQTDVRYERRRHDVGLDKETRLGVLTIRMELQGEYESLREFIYQLETAPEFVIIDDVTLTERDTSQPLTLAITLSTYFRAGGGDGP